MGDASHPRQNNCSAEAHTSGMPNPCFCNLLMATMSLAMASLIPSNIAVTRACFLYHTEQTQWENVVCVLAQNN